MPRKKKDIFEAGAFERPVGITAGGIGGGDGAKEKIGRGKIKWNQSGFRGSPSMAADSGFSSIVIKRVVSPDSVTHSDRPMFPNQDVKLDREDDNYLLDDDECPLSVKMKKSPVEIDENEIVENSQYSLVSLERSITEDVESWRDLVPDRAESAIDAAVDAVGSAVSSIDLPEPVEDAYEHLRDFLLDAKEKYGDPAIDAIVSGLESVGVDEENIEKATAVAKEIGRDIVMLAAAGTPVVGTPIAASYILFNLGEMQVGMNQARRAVDSLVLNGTESDVREVERVTAQLFNDYIDFLQAVPYLIPFVGTIKGAASIASKVTRGLSQSKVAAATLGGGVIKKSLRSEILLSPLFKIVTSIAGDVDTLDDVGVDSSYFFDNVYKVPATLAVLSDLLEEAESQEEEWRSRGSIGPFMFTPPYGSGSLTMGAEERASKDEYLSDLQKNLIDAVDSFIDDVESSGVENAADNLIGSSTIEESRLKGEDLIRQFIRETLYHAAPVGANPGQEGFAYRRPEEPKLEGEEEREEYKKDTGSLVNYKTDVGGVAYSPTPEDLREEALRRIIRRKLQEQKKTF